jgi:hypothetical protein
MELVSFITFSTYKIKLLEKGLKYNQHFQPKHWKNRLALKADTAINLADPLQQNYLRHAVAKELHRLKCISNHASYTHNSTHEIQEWKLIKQIKEKVHCNHLIVTRANKGCTLVMLENQEYDSKTMEFVNSNEFTECTTDPTKSFQKSIKSSFNSCNTMIPQNKKYLLTSLNPEPLHMKAFIKLHKVNTLKTCNQLS